MEIIYIILIGGAIIVLMKIFGKKEETTKEDEAAIDMMLRKFDEDRDMMTDPAYKCLGGNIFHRHKLKDHD